MDKSIQEQIQILDEQIHGAEQTVREFGADGGGWPERNLRNLQKRKSQLQTDFSAQKYAN